MKISESMFHKTEEELRKLDKENDIKLLRLLEYLKRRKIKNEKQDRLVFDDLEPCVRVQKEL